MSLDGKIKVKAGTVVEHNGVRLMCIDTGNARSCKDCCLRWRGVGWRVDACRKFNCSEGVFMLPDKVVESI